MTGDPLDVLIIGAGLSGIGAAHFIQRDCPERSFAILEARTAIGGTWDLFRYPGVRSDSDMYTLGYSFKPWMGENAIAGGPSILRYIQETADELNLHDKIRFEHKLVRASWSSKDALWSIQVEVGSAREVRTLTCRFLFFCSGYYDYDQGYLPHFEGYDDFGGTIVHPQFWPETLDYAGKTVVVIGSGATAVTLAPALAKHAQHVTMLQRTPSYLVSQPSIDPLASALRMVLPQTLAHKIARWQRIVTNTAFFKLARRFPGVVKKQISKGIRQELGDAPHIHKQFQPPYNPWRQRLCLVPDGDFFAAMRAEKVSVMTGEIARFDQAGLKLTSGEHVPADVIVTATGLSLKFLAGAQIDVDGTPLRSGEQLTYKGLMYNGVPNLASCFGYTNASWTLKSDLTGAYVARLLNEMARQGAQWAVPVLADPEVQAEEWVDFSSGYFQRSLSDIPKQGTKPPWQMHQNYFKDLRLLRYGAVDDGVMQFHSLTEPTAAMRPGS